MTIVRLILVWALALSACNGSSSGSSSLATEQRLFCDGSSWVAGVTELCSGHLVYRDYIYDDYGADGGLPSFPPISSGWLAPAAGDERYAAGAENTADLVRLELWLEGDQVNVELELNTLYEETQTLAAIAIDTDGNAETGGGAWPGLSISSAGWDEIHVFDHGDPATNLISGSFPRPPGETWKIWAVVAKSGGTVMNVAFRGPDETVSNRGIGAGGTFWEDRQAAALGAGDITGFAAEVAVADLTGGVTREAEIGPGLHQRVYTSAYTLPPGEGVSLGGVPGRHGDTGNVCEQAFHYLGKYQPYGVYLPDQRGPHGIQLALHGCSAGHASLINQPGMQRQLGEEQNRILLVPLGRGPVGFYSDISERDVLDVLSDVIAHYDVDEDQVFAGGYSMGGYGTLRFSALYPDLFAGAVNWVGFTGSAFNLPLPGNPFAAEGSGSGALGNMIDFVQNLRNVPIVNLYAAGDELVHVTTAIALQARFAETDVIHDFYVHPNAEHVTFAILDDWAKEAAYTAGRRRAHNPSRVTFRTNPSLDFPEYEITHDRAYWVSEVRGREAGYVDVDVTSRGCGQPDPVTALTFDAGTGPPPLVWTRQSRRIVGETETSPANRVEATLANVASFRVDPEGACLVGFAPLEYRVETDGPTEIDFGDGRTLSLEAAGVHEGDL